MKNFLLLSFLAFTFCVSFSQDTPPPMPVISVSASSGVLTFNGSIGKGKDVSKYTYIRGGYGLNIEKRFMKEWVGASLNVISGKLAMAERSKDTSRNKNFESSLMQFGLNLTFYLQNKKGIPIIPYATVGFAYAMLNPKTDLKYSGDSLYYYWSDGSIRNLSEVPINEFSAQHVERDYKYETALTHAATSAMSTPVGAGIGIQIIPQVEANVGVLYHLAMAKNIDGMNGAKNNKYLYSYFSVTYNFIKKTKEQKEKEKEASSVDFSSLDKFDGDGDGVKDKDDVCPGTPKGAKVDAKGCPTDEDDDGIPDYLDKEKGTKKGSIVDTDGKTVTDAMIYEKAQKDSLASARVSAFMGAPSAAALQQIDTDIKKKNEAAPAGKSSAKIPAQWQSADTNHDGIISSSEISAIIDGFFDGSNDYTVEKIHALIDFFFEQ